MRRWEPVNQSERELLEAVGSKPERFHVVSRHPWTIAIGRRAYLPGLAVALIVFGITVREDAVSAFPAAMLGGVVLTLGLAAHEAGHLLFGRRSRGVKPRMLVLFSGGGMSILEGRHKGPGGAAWFAAGGPIGSLLAGITFIGAGLLVPRGPFSTALLVPGVLTLALTAVNLVPVAPMDGYSLFRSWLWADLGNRAEAERRALDWSRVVLVVMIIGALLAFRYGSVVGFCATLVCATFVMQHHARFTRVMAESEHERRS